MQGTIQRLIRGKGFGFVLADDRQYFFHHTEVRGVEFKRLTPGDVVEFQPQDNVEGRNPRATDVIVIEKKERAPHRAAAGPRKPPRTRLLESTAAHVDPSDDDFVDGEPDGDAGEEDDADDREFITEFVDAPVVAPPSRETRRARPRTATTSRATGRRAPAPRADRTAVKARRRPRASGTPGDRGEGVVRAINVERGFGFIETSEGDLFFHRSCVAQDFEALAVGSRVAFVFATGDRGSKAEQVALR